MSEIDALIEAFDEPVLLVERGTVRAANRAARALLGGAARGRDVRLAIRHPAALAAIMAGQAGEVEVDRLGGGEARWTMTVRPLPRGTLLVRFADRTAELARERTRTDFVADASHELRTPLAAVLGYAETLALPDIDAAARTRFLDRLTAEARRMGALIDDLFALSRIEADRFQLPDTLVELGALVQAAAHHAAHGVETAGADIRIEVEPDLPPVRGDAGQLGQAIDNLVANALRHGCGTAGCTVTIALGRHGEWLRLAVRDEGPGVPAEALPRLALRFFRVDPARGRGGTGLGLSIVRRIAERHRGRLSFESPPGQGLSALLDLPPALSR